jgi:hypothetical protein
MVRNSVSWGRTEEKGYMVRWGVNRRTGEGLPCNVAEGNYNQVIVVRGKRWMDGQTIPHRSPELRRSRFIVTIFGLICGDKSQKLYDMFAR